MLPQHRKPSLPIPASIPPADCEALGDLRVRRRRRRYEAIVHLLQRSPQPYGKRQSRTDRLTPYTIAFFFFQIEPISFLVESNEILEVKATSAKTVEIVLSGVEDVGIVKFEAQEVIWSEAIE